MITAFDKEPKYQVGDVLKDTFNGKTGKVSRVVAPVPGDGCKDEWHYSIDHMGWLFIPESELEKVC